MSGATMLVHLILERLSRKVLTRVPESEPIMNDSMQNESFMMAGQEDGVLAFIYLYHALQISMLVRNGDRVLDLGCGPANQLAQIARLNPDAHFIGLDASTEMLDRAVGTIHQLTNIELVSGDMTALTGIDDASMDCVISTMSLHHLPDLAALSNTMREARRVLKPGGGVYFVDFGRFKRESTQRFFAQDLQGAQLEKFSSDYFNSLRAAFSREEFSRAAQLIGPGAALFSTPLAPFMLILKSNIRCDMDEKTRQSAQEMYLRMDAEQQKLFQLYARWLKAGGVALPFTPG